MKNTFFTSHTKAFSMDLNSEKLRIRFIYGCFLICVFLLLLAIIQTQRLFFSDSDGYGYYTLAIRILSGEIASSRQIQKWPPGYPVLLIAMNNFTNDYFLAAKLLMALFGTLYVMSSMLIAYLFLRNHTLTLVFGINICIKTAIWAVLALITDVPFAFCFQMAVYYLLLELQAKNSDTLNDNNMPQTTSNQNHIFAGIFTGFSCLLRWTGVVLILIAIILMLLPAFFRKGGLILKLKHAVHTLISKQTAFFIGFLFGVWSLWLIPNWIIFGSPFHTIIHQEPILWGPCYAQLGLDPAQFTSLIDVFLYNPILLLKNFIFVFGWHCLYFIYEIFLNERLIFDLGVGPAAFIYSISLGISIYGYIVTARQNEYKRAAMIFALALVVFLFLIMISISVPYRRFIYPITPFGSLFFFLGLSNLWNSIKKLPKKIAIFEFKQKKIVAFVLLLITCANGWGGYYHIGREMHTKYHNAVELEIVGAHLQKHTNSTNIAFPRNNYWYYYKPEIINISSANYFPKTIGDLNTLQADFIVFAQGYDLAKNPQFEFLLYPDDPRIPSHFEVFFYEIAEYNDWIPCDWGYCIQKVEKIIVIYKIYQI
jgi:hypothetical protein